jgi:thiol-disulfide isomerase/thioredoxin
MNNSTPVETISVPTIATSTATSTSSVMDRRERIALKESKFEHAKEITTPDGFINTGGKALKLADLIGKKVVIIDFWTYSCINCQRTLPYLNAWYAKYKDFGLEIVGLQTPEFEFEKNYANVENAVNKFGIKFPVVLDNDFSTWQAYQNHYWPHKYLIDIDGFIAYDHVGEGGYAETEQKIQAALKERSDALGLGLTIPTGTVDPTSAVKSVDARSPETYFGAARNEYLGNGTPGEEGIQTYSIPDVLKVNTLYLGGEWNMLKEYAQSTSQTSKIVYQYGAKSIYFVASAKNPVTVTVKKDGVVIKTITIKDAGLYTLSEDQTANIHTLELDIEGAGLEAFTFTFG